MTIDFLEETPTRTNLGKSLRTLREAAGLSYNALGDRAHIDAKYLYNLEAGKRENPSRNALIRIGIGLGLDVASLDELLVATGHVGLIGRV
jgi:transcriptional regulator with XRE-family HTH domain